MRLGMGSGLWAGLDLGTYSVKLVTMHPSGSRCRFAEAVVPRTGGDEPPTASVLAGLIDDCASRTNLSARGFRGISVGVSGPDARLDRALAPLRELGVEAGIVDAAPLALANALAQATGRDADGDGAVRLLLDVGHLESWLSLHHRGHPLFTRRLEWGGARLTEAVADATGCGLDRAEAWKLDANASLTQAGPEAAAARSAVESMGEELRRSFAFYRTIAALPEALTLRLCGGTARLGGLAERLGEIAGVTVSPFSPLDVHERGGRAAAGGPQFTQAYGLALRAA